MTAPDRIGPYVVLETTDARAFTIAYRASHARLDRRAILKVLKTTVSIDSPFAADLEREAAVLGGLDHEGIIRLHDFVREGGAIYLVLEDAPGASLDAILRGAKHALDHALAISLALARAVAHAHERGVVLRALAPDRVVVTPSGRVYIADLSSALAPADLSEDRPERTESAAVPSYMAPEQILGDPATPRSDVWSLGAILHEAIAGARPFDADDPRLLASRIRNDAPAPLPSSTPPAIARLVTRCLAKEPADRFPDAAPVAAALEEALAERTRIPVPVLATRALAASRLGDALPAPPGLGAPDPRVARTGPDVARTARALAIVFSLTVVGGAAIRLLGTGDDDAPGDGVAELSAPVSGPRDRGHLRIVARPWAEVLIDGQQVDTTPIGRPIPVTPGKHFVTFRHPRAPEEQRTIKIAAGQTVFLDVSMRVERGDAGYRGDAGKRAEPSP